MAGLRAGAAAGLAALVLTLASCGDDGSTTQERPDATVTPSGVIDPVPTTAPTAPPTSVPTVGAAPGGTTYIVQPGDLLGTIAQAYGVSVDAIVEANNLPDANMIIVGQELVIPAPG